MTNWSSRFVFVYKVGQWPACLQCVANWSIILWCTTTRGEVWLQNTTTPSYLGSLDARTDIHSFQLACTGHLISSKNNTFDKHVHLLQKAFDMCKMQARLGNNQSIHVRARKFTVRKRSDICHRSNGTTTPALCMMNCQAERFCRPLRPFISTPSSPDSSLASSVSAPSQLLQIRLLASSLSPSHALPSSQHVWPPDFCAHSPSEVLWIRTRANHLLDPWVCHNS